MYGKYVKWLFTLGLATAIGCGNSGSSGEEGASESSGESQQALQAAPGDACQRVFSIELPPGFNSDQIVLGSTSKLTLSDQVKLANANGQGFPTASNMGTGSLTVGNDATSGSLFARGQVSLGDRAAVRGSITTEARVLRGSQTLVTGTVSEHATLTPTNKLAWQVCFPASNSGPVNIEPDKSRVLAPGDYGALTVKSRATLSLSAGKYTFQSISIEPQAKLQLNKTQGPISMYSLTTFTFRGTLVNGGGAPADLLVGAFGSGSVEVDAPFRGTVVAPNGQLVLASVAAPGHRGAFFAKEILARPASTITHEPFSDFGPIVGPDQDDDGISDPLDNCPTAANANQLDGDNDKVGDVCDLCPAGATGAGVVGPAGGLICADNERVALRIPPGAVAANVNITITPSSVNPPDSGLLPGRVYDFGPHGLEFAVPPLLTIAYTESDVPAGVNEASLIILSSVHGSAPITDENPWEERFSTVDTTANRVSGTIEHFSHDGIGLPAVRVEMSEVSITVPVGDTHPLTAVPFDALNGILNHIVDWTSNNVAAAGVVPTSIQGQQLGSVIANGVGTAVVRAAVRNSAENVAGNTGVNVTARPRRVTFSGSIFVLDDDFSPIGENDDCGQFTFQDFCEVTASAPTSTITIGGSATCVDDEAMSTTTAVCTLDPATESVTVSITTRLFEENACPNSDLDGEGSLTSVLAIGQSESRTLHVDNTDEGGDFTDWSLTITNAAATGPSTRTIGGGSVSCP